MQFACGGRALADRQGEAFTIDIEMHFTSWGPQGPPDRSRSTMAVPMLWPTPSDDHATAVGGISRIALRSCLRSAAGTGLLATASEPKIRLRIAEGGTTSVTRDLVGDRNPRPGRSSKGPTGRQPIPWGPRTFETIARGEAMQPAVPPGRQHRMESSCPAASWLGPRNSLSVATAKISLQLPSAPAGTAVLREKLDQNIPRDTSDEHLRRLSEDHFRLMARGATGCDRRTQDNVADSH